MKETFGSLPDADHDVKLKVAEASVSYLRSMTNANAVMVDGISDSDANRRLWKEYAFEAYDLLKEVHKSRPDDPHVHVLMAEVRSLRISLVGWSGGWLYALLVGTGSLCYSSRMDLTRTNFDSPYRRHSPTERAVRVSSRRP